MPNFHLFASKTFSAPRLSAAAQMALGQRRSYEVNVWSLRSQQVPAPQRIPFLRLPPSEHSFRRCAARQNGVALPGINEPRVGEDALGQKADATRTRKGRNVDGKRAKRALMEMRQRGAYFLENTTCAWKCACTCSA